MWQVFKNAQTAWFRKCARPVTIRRGGADYVIPGFVQGKAYQGTVGDMDQDRKILICLRVDLINAGLEKLDKYDRVVWDGHEYSIEGPRGAGLGDDVLFDKAYLTG